MRGRAKVGDIETKTKKEKKRGEMSEGAGGVSPAAE